MSDNILPIFTASGWYKKPTNVSSIYDDGRSSQFVVDDDSDYYEFRDATQRYNGRTLKLSWGKFTSTDGNARCHIRMYTDATNYTTVVDLREADEQTGNYASEIEFTVPSDTDTMRVYFRNDSPLAEPYANQTITLEALSLVDTTVVSTISVNFWKVMEDNLPTSVTPGTEHVFFTFDGSVTKLFVSTKDGNIVQVHSGDIIGGGEMSYTNVYTQAHIDERKEDIEALQRAGNTITFVTPTDIHVREAEDGNSGRYDRVRDLKLLTSQIQVDYITCLGDILSYSAEFTGYEPRLEKVAGIFNECRVPWFATRGNHDYNSDDASYGENPYVADVNENTAYDLLVRNEDWFRSIDSRYGWGTHLEIVFDPTNPKGNYFYVNDHSKKHRLIYLNSFEIHEDSLGRPYINNGVLDCYLTGVAQTKKQIQWLMDHALDMTGKTEWVVTFFSHMIPYTDANSGDTSEFHGYGSDHPQMRHIIQAFQNGTDLVNYAYACVDTDTHSWGNHYITKNFSAQGPIRVSGWHGGHVHADCYRKLDGLNLCVSTCTADSQRTSWPLDVSPTIPPPTRDTAETAMSINVWIINTDTRTVDMIKVGSKENNAVKTSSDISFTY